MTTATAPERKYREITTERGPVTTGLRSDFGGQMKNAVERGGGKFGNGLIHHPAIISRGEALGHYFWIDEAMLLAVSTALNAAGAKGVKSRLGHPSWTDDRTGASLGRVVGSSLDGDRVIAGGLHISAASSKSPEGDLADWVLTQAEEDPEAFGMSIVFDHDREAETAFLMEHGAEEKGDWFGKYLSLENFVSPDPLNTENLPHSRLLSLRGVDVVDSPAANPNGLLSESQITQTLMLLPPSALRETVSRVFRERGIDPQGDDMPTELKEDRNNPTKEETDDTSDEETPAKSKLEESEEEQTEPASKEAETETLSAAQSLINQYTDKFGEKGLEYLGAGLTLEEAQTKFNADLVKQNQELQKKLSAVTDGGGTLGDPDGVTHSPTEGNTTKPRPGLTGFAAALDGQIRIAVRNPVTAN